MERKALGADAEELIAKFLEHSGYRIRDRNKLCRHGELDIIAERGEVLAFVEVRMRSSRYGGDPTESVTRAKQRRVILAATEYCQRHRLFDRAIRFDVAGVLGQGGTRTVLYTEEAFSAWY